MQMDNPTGDDVRSGRANVRLGLFDEKPGMTDATLVLLRIENDGSQSIAGDDYTSRERHALTAVFTDRTILGVSVTQPPGTDHLMDHFTPPRDSVTRTASCASRASRSTGASTSSSSCCCRAGTWGAGYG